jgi:outer membrane protein OmpA-like peptidoglycan-associated protein
MNVLTIGKTSVALSTVFLLGLGTTGCATKKYTRGVVAPVEARVTTNEKKTADHASAIGELENGLSRTDEKAMDADRKAVAAGQEAAKANQAAGVAQQSAELAKQGAEQARKVADNGMTRIGEVVENFDNYKLVTTEKVLFPFGKSILTKDAKAQLDGAVGGITAAKNYVLEVQGFTDKTGNANGNIVLSQKRADEVVRYLTTQHHVPLRTIHVLGLGADEPTADNTTRDGRKQNRRVEMKVFALDLGSGPTKSGTQASSK